MPTYRYEAVAASGELLNGEMDAPDQHHVIEHLQSLGHVPIHADEARRAWFSRLSSRSLGGSARPRTGDLVLLTQQLGTLLHAGLSLDRALEITRTMVEGKAERECLKRVLDMVRGGSSLADAMAAQNGLFPPSYIGAVRAGETGGSLDATLQNLAEFLERSQAAREQVKSALIYPILVLVTGCGSVAVLFGFVVPRFRPVFAQLGAAPPMATQIVLTAGDLFSAYWWVPLALAGLLYLFLRGRSASPEVRRRWHARLLSMPRLGDLIVKIEMARFGRTLGTLLKNGVPPVTALAITEQTLNNTALRAVLGAVSDNMKEGKGLAEPLAQTPFIPPLVVHMVRVGEETARLDDLLLKLAEIYERETRRSIDRLLALLVPAITIGLGLVVAAVIGSILTSILSIYDLAL